MTKEEAEEMKIEVKKLTLGKWSVSFLNGRDKELMLMEDIIKIIDKHTKQEPKTGQWIPVSERLPEPESYVLICLDDGYVTDDYYGLYGTNDFDAFKDGSVEEKVVAWMPLPEPYRAERKG